MRFARWRRRALTVCLSGLGQWKHCTVVEFKSERSSALTHKFRCNSQTCLFLSWVCKSQVYINMLVRIQYCCYGNSSSTSTADAPHKSQACLFHIYGMEGVSRVSLPASSGQRWFVLRFLGNVTSCLSFFFSYWLWQMEKRETGQGVSLCIMRVLFAHKNTRKLWLLIS